MPRGFFITFEGLDGSGKTTQIRRLTHWLESRCEPVTLTRQPGGTEVGDRIRGLILDSRVAALSPVTELALMFADRAQCIAQVINPALTSGRTVLCDRFTDSTEAYQGGGRQLGSAVVLALHQTICAGLQPDLTFLLLPSLDRSLRRARHRNQRIAEATGADENRFEREQDDFFRRTSEAYRAIAARELLRVVTIEGDLSVDAVHNRIVSVVCERLRARIHG